MSTQISNKSHQYFIEILNETLQILKPFCKERQQTTESKAKAAETGEKDIAALSNLFEHLDVDEPAEWTSTSLPSKKAKSACTYELEVEQSDVEISFAIFCVFKDFTDIRHYIRQTVSKPSFETTRSWRICS